MNETQQKYVDLCRDIRIARRFLHEGRVLAKRRGCDLRYALVDVLREWQRRRNDVGKSLEPAR